MPTAHHPRRVPAPSRLGDMLDWRLVPVRARPLAAASCGRAGCAGEPRVSFDQTLVWIDMDGGRPRPWPEALRARIEDEMPEGNDA